MSSVLSISHSAKKVNAFVPLQVITNVFIITSLLQSSLSDALLSLVPVTIDKVPYFCLFLLLLLWMFTRIAVVLGTANTRKPGYDNETPRRTNTVEYLGDELYTLQCAHDNTLEAIVVATVASVVASNLDLDPTVFAKLSIFNLLARIAYPYLYVYGPDMVRSFVFSYGFFSSLGIIVYGLFPQLF